MEVLYVTVKVQLIIYLCTILSLKNHTPSHVTLVTLVNAIRMEEEKCADAILTTRGLKKEKKNNSAGFLSRSYKITGCIFILLILEISEK